VKRQFELSELDCANCAAKMEAAAAKVEGVQNVKVNFITQKLTLTADDSRFDQVLEEVVKVCRKVEPDCLIQTK
jgi:copper chaperone CopZ